MKLDSSVSPGQIAVGSIVTSRYGKKNDYIVVRIIKDKITNQPVLYYSLRVDKVSEDHTSSRAEEKISPDMAVQYQCLAE